ncbi:MAG: hypothetical protein H7838_11455, partial [Magnetococcus sp. DMHC-8]
MADNLTVVSTTEVPEAAPSPGLSGGAASVDGVASPLPDPTPLPDSVPAVPPPQAGPPTTATFGFYVSADEERRELVYEVLDANKITPEMTTLKDEVVVDKPEQIPLIAPVEHRDPQG